MEEVVRKDLIRVLRSTLKILEQKEPNTNELKQLSNTTIHNASIYQDEYSISLAILVYSLSKTLERVLNNIQYSKIKNLISLSIEYLEDENYEHYKDFIKKIFDIIANTDKKFRFYIQEVVGQASIRKGSKLYEHGLSASKTSSMLGISLWELYNYLGAITVEDETSISSLRKRIEFTRRLFS